MARRLHLPVLVAFAVAALFLALGTTARGAAGVGGARVAAAKPLTKSPSNGATVSGRIRWRVAVQGAKPRRIVFRVDGRVTAYRRHRRAAATLDTTRLSNGPHTLTAIAVADDGRRPRRTRVRIKVDNSSSRSETDPTPPVPAHGPSSVYWGAQIGSHVTGTQAPWDMNAVSVFEREAGKPLSMIHFAAPFANCSSTPCVRYGFPLGEMNTVRQHGAIPFFSWASQSIGQGGDTRVQPNFQLSDVIAGTHDATIRDWATAAKNWGHPFFLRFNFEMNGTWFPWSEGVNGNQPGEYVRAWRHVHDIFTSVGADNATWVWCPNVDPDRRYQDLARLYPGDAYVDWTCLDGYNWGVRSSGPGLTTNGWKSFDQIYRTTYDEITGSIAPSKPMVIGEIGSTENGGSKAAWLEDALAKAPSYPKIRGFLYFEKFDDGMDWPISTSASATDAFARGIASSAYTTNQFGSLDGGKIQPPS